MSTSQPQGRAFLLRHVGWENQSSEPQRGQGASSAGREGSMRILAPHTGQRFGTPSGVRDEITTRHLLRELMGLRRHSIRNGTAGGRVLVANLQASAASIEKSGKNHEGVRRRGFCGGNS
jgi:hypothetical protein